MKDNNYSINPKYYKYWVKGLGTLRTRALIEHALHLELPLLRLDRLLNITQQHDYKTGTWIDL